MRDVIETRLNGVSRTDATGVLEVERTPYQLTVAGLRLPVLAHYVFNALAA